MVFAPDRRKPLGNAGEFGRIEESSVCEWGKGRPTDRLCFDCGMMAFAAMAEEGKSWPPSLTFTGRPLAAAAE